jgi:uncharacterized membrane protein (DUF4010 family)
MLDILQPFVISFFIGLIIGIERERSFPKGMQAFGVRTFILVALLGTLTAWFNNHYLTIIVSCFTLTAILLGYYRASIKNIESIKLGLTTEFAVCLVFFLGFMVIHQAFLAALLGTVVLLVLLEKKRLHSLARKRLQPKELTAITVLLILSLGIIPFLPNRTIDPWALFNPQRFGILIFALAIIQFTGYVTMRIMGRRLGMVLTGFFGGIVSSTAVFASLPHLVKSQPELTPSATAAAIMATIASLLVFASIMLIASPALFTVIIWPIISMSLVGMLSLIPAFKKETCQRDISPSSNPLDLIAVLKLALLIGGMLIVTTIAQKYFNTRGVEFVAFLGGLFELHGISLAISTLFVETKIQQHTALIALGLAVLASFITKFILLWSLARNRFALITSSILLLMLGSGLLTIYILPDQF